MNHDHWKKLSRQVDAIIEKQRGQLARIATTGEQDPIGRLLRFDLAIDMEPDWLVVGIAPQPDQYVIVPADDYPLLRPSDLVLGLEHPNGPLTLRCGNSITLPREFLDWGRCVDVLGEDVVQQVRNAIEESREPSDDEIFELDPDEEDWLEAISAAGGTLSELPNTDRTVRLSDFHKDHEIAQGAPMFPAADSEITSSIDKTKPRHDQAPLAVDIPMPVMGRLFAVLEGRQIRFWHQCSKDGIPPELVLIAEQSESTVQWMRAPTDESHDALFYSKAAYTPAHGTLEIAGAQHPKSRYQLVLPENHDSAQDH